MVIFKNEYFYGNSRRQKFVHYKDTYFSFIYVISDAHWLVVLKCNARA